MSDLDPPASVTPRRLAELAACGPAALPSPADGELLIANAAALDRAGPGDLTVFDVEADLDDLAATRAAACFVPADLADAVPPETIALVTTHSLTAFHVAVAMLRADGPPARKAAGVDIDISARIDAQARLEQGAVISAFVVLGPGVEIGAGTTIGAHCVIGAGVKIGRGCVVDAHVSIAKALIGDRVVIHAGVRIGTAYPEVGRGDVALGRVIIQDDVVIGPNATVERGDLRDTVVGEGTMIGALAAIGAQTVLDRKSRAFGRGFSLSSEMV